MREPATAHNFFLRNTLATSALAPLLASHDSLISSPLKDHPSPCGTRIAHLHYPPLYLYSQLPPEQDTSTPNMDLRLRKRSRTDEGEASSSSIVQVPKDLLQKLLSSVESVEHIQNAVKDLQQTVSRLEKDKNYLKTELQALQDRDGPRFPQFSRLPPEIRRMIVCISFSSTLTCSLHYSVMQEAFNTIPKIRL